MRGPAAVAAAADFLLDRVVDVVMPVSVAAGPDRALTAR
jgi:hypothetical protein